MGWDERLSFNASDPPADGLVLMVRELSSRRAKVVEVRRLAGGVDAATHAVRLEPGGWLVVKRVRAQSAWIDSSGSVLLHHDFHHGNVLWQASRVTGVLDWNEACLGPALCDVGYCSVDLAMTHGPDASDMFSSAYAAAVGAQLDDLDRWQCLWTANAMRWIKYWISGFHEAGINLSLPVARQGLIELADRTLRRLSTKGRWRP